MKKQSKITEQTRQNLIDAFWGIYCTNRIDKITIMDITTKVGYNRGTFYEYFKDVYDVLEYIENSLFSEMNEFPPIEYPLASSPLPIDGFIKLYETHSKYFIVLLGDNGDPSFLNKLKSTTKPKLKQILVAQGATDDFELDYTIEYTLSAMIGILSYWFKNEDTPPTERLLSLMYDIMRDGVMNKLSKL